MSCLFSRTSLTRGLLLACGISLLAACSDDESGSRKRKRPPHLVSTAMISMQDISLKTTRTGTLKAKRTVRIFNQDEGRITAVLVDEGDPVTKGQIVIRLDDSLVQAQLAKAAANRQQAALDLDRIQRLFKNRLTSADTLANARTAHKVAIAEEDLLRTRLAFTRIKAPFDGIVSKRTVEPGDVAAKHTHMLTLIDPTSLITEVSISELLLPGLKTGSPVSIRIDALGGKHHPGQISRIHPTIDTRTRQAIVEIAITPIPAGARAGQLCRVTLATRFSERIFIPFSALRKDKRGLYVFVLNNKSMAIKRYITTGIRSGNKLEAISGLKPGDRIIIRGFLGLKHGKKVQPADARPAKGSRQK